MNDLRGLYIGFKLLSIESSNSWEGYEKPIRDCWKKKAHAIMNIFLPLDNTFLKYMSTNKPTLLLLCHTVILFVCKWVGDWVFNVFYFCMCSKENSRWYIKEMCDMMMLRGIWWVCLLSLMQLCPDYSTVLVGMKIHIGGNQVI